MTKKILILMKGPLERAVPIISVACHFAAMGYQVTVGAGICGETLRENMASTNLSILELDQKSDNLWLPQIVRKIKYWASFRKRASRLMERKFDLIYIGSADTAIALYGLLPAKKYVLHLRELHDTQPLYMYGLRSLARNAFRVVVPEINRAYLYKNFLRLTRLPVVIPNKPFTHLRRTQLPIDFLPSEMREAIGKKKFLIYQGPIHPERDLKPILRALKKLPDFAFVVMGRDYGELSSYQEIMPQLIHIPFIVPPLHLNVTSWAAVGLITYDDLSLNTVYCAPNKIWEYSGFGLPMLCNDNLGLRYSVAIAGAGEVVDINDSEAVLSALRRIECNYDLYRQKANSFFDSVDVGKVLEEIVAKFDEAQSLH